MNEIKIVNYDPKYAASIAEMWNKSGDNWGGQSVIRTPESVIQDEENFGNIHTFLALHGDDVVGYCSFSNYKEDEGASYIPLLNVRPDYHGKKVGKKLVLACVDAATKAEWPRLDLYTWPGNEKAVPLYKKCGFFWEQSDKFTHLMNFLPYVMDTDAVKGYFDTIDWYKDNKREIVVEFDGNVEGKFHFYEYKWQKNDLALNMEFERRGRGLTCIETNDYKIKTRLSSQDLIVGREYDITYEVINKSDKPLDIEIKGLDNKNIKYSTQQNLTISDKQTVTGKFYLGAIKEKQEKIKTHPCVTSLITINGKDALFKIGINPKFPVEIEVANSSELKFLDKENTCYINIENNFNEDIHVEFSLDNNDCVIFTTPQITTELKAKQKKSLPIPCVVKKYGFYSREIMVNITTSTGQISHIAQIRTAFRGYKGKYHGETDESYNVYYGSYEAKLNKVGNVTLFSKLGIVSNDRLWASIPQLGKPYYAEFKNKKPAAVDFISKENSEVIKATFKSEKFAGVIMYYYIELFQDGIINLYCDIKDTSKNKAHTVHVSQECYFYLINAYIPYEGDIIYSNNFEGFLTRNWDVNKVNESWFYTSNRTKSGLSWHPSSKVTFNYISATVESDLGSLANNCIRTKPITYTLDTFNTWQSFREYLGYTKPLNSHRVKKGFVSNINNDNPFVMDTVDIKCHEYKAVPIAGKLSIKTKNNSLSSTTRELEFTSNESLLSCPVVNKPELDIITMNIETKIRNFTRKKAVFFKGNNEIVTKKYTEHEKEVFEVSNNLITLKASPDFSAGLYYMSYKGTEWLDNSFPTPCIKGWWNYWTGGISITPTEFSFASVFKEKKSADFVALSDNHGNEWSGIKNTLYINEHEKFKGVTVDEYYLLMSGAPVVCNFAVVHQKSGHYMSDMSMVQLSFINAGKELTDNKVIYTENGNTLEYVCGLTEYDLGLEKYVAYTSKNNDYILTRVLFEGGTHWITNTNLITASGDKYIFNANDGDLKQSKPQFMVFSKENLNEEMLRDLKKLTFSI